MVGAWAMTERSLPQVVRGVPGEAGPRSIPSAELSSEPSTTLSRTDYLRTASEANRRGAQPSVARLVT
ncbi:hypothetical protein PC128_g6552 [Phytophthora cactorum]|nr:hypothetical protein PC128_g6552 [Phytophthora cactorum]